MHRAGIEVILDVVFNHTDEGDHRGPVINFKGVDNQTYYYLSPFDRSYYMNYTGCGNTLNCNHPISQKMILDCVQYWVRECHVDGFRFDMGSILSRGEDGTPLKYPPVVWQIELDDVLAQSKVIAEAWDAAGLYQIGHFPGDRWSEWNGRYRDDVRRFVRGDPGLVGAVATRLAGSSDLFGDLGELPINSINFITCHDGFTMNDLVSYNVKHNEANGEGNRDGVDDNHSWNCGVEGATNDPAVEGLRNRQIRNFATILMLSRGVPMFLAGDEIRHTQKGNNNAYCQNNEVSWLDWSQVERYEDIFRFWKRIIEFRKTHKLLRLGRFFTGARNERGLADVAWHGCRLNQPGWNDPSARALAVTYGGFDGDADIHVMMNMYWESLEFDVPTVPGRRWFRSVDTSLRSPRDIADPGDEALFGGPSFRVAPRSIAILISR
jgi:glycogen operon protein